MPTMSDIKIGDIVKPTAENLPTVQKWAGPSQGNRYRVTNLSEQFSEIFVQPIPAIAGRKPEAFMATRFELVTDRVEGEEILPKYIKVGDEILVTRVGHDKITHTRQAVVGNIKENNDQYGRTLVFQSEVRAGKINWGQDFTETFTLIKAAPDKDLLLERLTNSTLGQVVTFGTYLARRNFNTTWTILDGTRTTVETVGYLRKLMGDAEVKFLKVEAK